MPFLPEILSAPGASPRGMLAVPERLVPSWTPLDDPDIYADFPVSTLDLGAGSWADNAGNVAPLTQTSAGNRGTISGTLGGKDLLVFNGSTTWWNANSLAYGTPSDWTIFAVFVLPNQAASTGIAEQLFNSRAPERLRITPRFSGGVDSLNVESYGTVTNNYLVNNETPGGALWVVWSLGSTPAIYRNGVSQPFTGPAAWTPQVMGSSNVLGAQSNGAGTGTAGQFFKGDLAEIAFFTRAFSAADVAGDLAGYVSREYGL